ncbi:UNVERIFIED_CONTAM: putative germin-like protein 2-1 [Sesamum radiatum]|uniref:Germin-like protein 2-1 n=1 Tax=Sesamum radiatum TaxID=300843 RepID=A0AAW2LUE7_SESRA
MKQGEAMASHLLILLLISISSIALASDPSPLQDFCVAHPNGPVQVNGFACKDPKLAQPTDFFFSGLHLPGNTSNPSDPK